MAFKEITDRVSPGGAVTEASFRLKRRGKSRRPSLTIALKKSLLERIQWGACGINLLIGEGEDAGKVRLRKVAKGTGLGQLIVRKGSGVMDFGYVACFGERETEKVGVSISIVEANVLEITLPEDLEEHTYDDDPRPARQRERAEATTLEPSAEINVSVTPPNGALTGRHVSQVNKGPAPAPARTAKEPVQKNGVRVDFTPLPKISHKGEELELTSRQASFLSVLVRGFGDVMLTGDIMHKAGIATAAQVSDDFLVLGKVLPDLGLKIRFVPKMGYSLSVA